MRATLNLWVLVCCGLVLVLPRGAQAQVRATLVASASSVQPGTSIRLALRLDHDPTWHTYWVNAGIGYATSIRWELPEGWSAGAIDWPVPELIHNTAGAVTGHGYSGTVFLPVTLAVPKSAHPTKTVTLVAHASWLMCAQECIPKKEDLRLELPVSMGSPKVNAAVRAALAATRRPESLPKDWGATARRSGATVVLTVTGAASAVHFFGEDELIAFEAPQKMTSDRGAVVATLPVSKDAPADITRLIGVLTGTDAVGAARAIRIDVPLSTAGVTGP